AHFAEAAEARDSNREAKERLCAEAEALRDSTDWKATSDKLRALQAQWKTIGPVGKAERETLWQRFRAACDHFFERKKAHFAELDGERQVNLQKKALLCQRAEALSAAGRDHTLVLTQLDALEAEWRTIGPAPRDDADAIWKRFQKALQHARGRAEQAVA